MRTIALEEHYATTAFLRGPGSWLASRAGIVEPISDLGDGRIAAMDDAGVDLAVLSLAAPGVEQLDGTRSRGQHANATTNSPRRWHAIRIGWPGLRPCRSARPTAAADELSERCANSAFPAR